MSTEPPEPPDAPVGYKSPPKHSRFKKGQSGNPSGKRKGKGSCQLHFDPFDVLAKVLAEPIQVTKNGKSKNVSLFEAFVRKTSEAALKGDSAARKDIIKLIGQLPKSDVIGEDDTLAESEEMVIELRKTRPFKPGGTVNG
ncbi:hypothetical protein ASG72_04235 [Bosea sp. Leaf344]|uniref:DUF5681 domain-containing protein n=1 Tax=Bosea sp. Leaf344 TaxID=1736346 RepID=UPI000715DFBA|nr:DUF5681 domain-containing protein [Bosea sp. Leaf344]KQU54825.1 hypothetical protein ASG72_04235 [Bosea sp. Leaf344]